MKKIIKRQRKTNPIAKQLSNPMWKQRIVRNKISYTRKLKYKEEELDEITATGNIDGYSTPFAFSGNKGKKKKKKIATNSTGYNIVKEALEAKDIAIIKKLIRDVIADVYRDIWIKRTTWK